MPFDAKHSDLSQIPLIFQGCYFGIETAQFFQFLLTVDMLELGSKGLIVARGGLNITGSVRDPLLRP